MAGEPSRCTWAGDEADPLLVAYHDREWGVPSHDDRHLFEMLVLEGAQAGLSWLTILRKREGYRRAFDGFDPAKVARFGPRRLERLVSDPGIVRNRSKIEAAVANARATTSLQRGGGSLDEYLWSFVGGATIRYRRRAPGAIPSTSRASVAMSRALAKGGFRFVGPTICYAFMQAVGMMNDHLVTCFRYSQV